MPNLRISHKTNFSLVNLKIRTIFSFIIFERIIDRVEFECFQKREKYPSLDSCIYYTNQKLLKLISSKIAKNAKKKFTR